MTKMLGVLVKGREDTGDSWDKIASTCAKYGINWLVQEGCGTYFARYQSAYVPMWSATNEIAEGIAAAHARGMKFSLMMLFGFRPTWQAPDPTYDVTQNDGNLYGWLCFTKQASKALVKNIVEEIATKFPDLDDFMFDYIRYEWWGQCYCEECHQRFMQDTGLTDVVWRDDVIDTGRYFNQYLSWRKTVVTEMVQNVRAWMKAINPNLTFSAAVLTAFSNTAYWVNWVGQDTPTYIDNGYLDMACNMAYTPDIADLTDYITSSLNLYTRGKCPLRPYIGGIENQDSDMTPQQMADVVKKTLELAPDGCVIYRYTNATDFEPYLKAAFSTPPPSLPLLPIAILAGIGTILYFGAKKL